MKFCTAPNGNRVAYQLVGSSATIPLVLVHGFCEDHSIWESLLPDLSSRSIILIDMPGFGSSELPTEPTMTEYAQALLAVLDATETSKCVLIGHSMGGYAGLEFASLWPERLAGLGLFHSHPYEDSVERKNGRKRGIETLQAGKKELYVTQLFPNLFPKNFAEERPAILNALIANGKKQSAAGISAALAAMLTRRDHQNTLASPNSCPVLLLLGAQDTLVPAQQGLQAALLPMVADLHLLPAVAHMGMYEASQESAAILNSFWQLCNSKLLG